MIVELLHKEYKENFKSKNENLSIFRRVFSVLSKMIFLGIFIALEVYIFIALDKKLMEFSKYGSLDFLILFLVILLVITLITSLIKARNVFYKRRDSEVLLHLPINNDEVIFSKILFTYLYSVLINFIISAPLLYTYGALRGIEGNIYPSYYVLSSLYPFFVSFFISGLTLTLLPLYNKVYSFLKNKPLIQILIGGVLVIILCFLYQYILNLFINLINDSKFDSFISEGFINSLHEITPFLFPVSGLVNMTHKVERLFNNISISFGVSLLVLLIGFFISSISYTKFLKNEFESSKKPLKVKKKKNLDSSFKALLKKEFILIFRNSNYIFSYTALLIMQPFLAFVVISSLNDLLYVNMKMFLEYFPELINGLNILLLLLFSSIITSASLDGYTRENKNIIVVKYLPISPIKQSLIKILIPIIFSSISLIFTNLILVSFNKISVSVFFISTLIGLLLQVSLSLGGLYIDFIKLNDDSKNNISYLSTLISIVFPLFITLIHFLMSYFKMNSALIYFMEILVTLLITLSLTLPFKRIVNKYFIKMRIN